MFKRLEHYTPLLIFLHDVIILTQNEAIGASPPSLEVAAPIDPFWVTMLRTSCINIKRGVLSDGYECY